MKIEHKECDNVCDFVNEYIRIIKSPYGSCLVRFYWLEPMIKKFSIDEIIFFDAELIQMGATGNEKLKLKLDFLTHLDKHSFWVIRKYFDESEILAKMKKSTELKGCEDNGHIISMYGMITDYLPSQMYSSVTKVFRINKDLSICLSVPIITTGYKRNVSTNVRIINFRKQNNCFLNFASLQQLFYFLLNSHVLLC